MKTAYHHKLIFLVELPVHGDDHLRLPDSFQRPGFIEKVTLNVKYTISIRL
jgi:hypothetical protein